MKTILEYLYSHNTLQKEQAKQLLLEIAQGKYNDYQLASFLTVFVMRSITVDELSGFREALLEMCVPVDLSAYRTIDLCGTGGDGKNTFNISTLASFVVAGAGEKVAKHGNYGVSSFCGSSNVMEHLGYRFKQEEAELQRELEQVGICFLHAPLFNPAMKNIAPVRKLMGVRTFFNMLGPLVNPSRPQHQIMGVYSLELARLYQHLLQQTSSNYTIIHGIDGFDEVSLTDQVKLISNSKEELLKPEDFAYSKLKEEDLFGGQNIDEAAQLFVKILKGEGSFAQNAVVTCNAGLAIHCLHPEITREEAMNRACESLESKRAYGVFKQLLKV